LPETICGPGAAGQPALLKTLVAAATKTETAPFQPQAMQAASGDVPVYRNLGALAFNVGTRVPQAQAYFNQGVRLAFAFNHAEAQRAFQAAQRLDPKCAMCFWGEALVLGPNINAPMVPEANAPALAALARATELKAKAGARDRALIDALAKRYSADAKADRAPLDVAYADAMKEVAARFPADDTVQALYAEAAMDTQPWDYWEAAGARPKGRGAEIIRALESVLKRNPSHPGAIHLYIHAVEASTNPERALPHAKRLAALMPGAGHVVHMPAHIYYRVGLYRDSLVANQRAIQVDEDYFKTSPSDPMYKAAYYPHNIHFVMVSAQMGGDAKTAIAAAEKLDAAMPNEAVQAFAVLQPVKASPYTTHAQFSDADTILKLKAPPDDLVLVKTMYHYARASPSPRARTLPARRSRSTRSPASSATPTSSRSRPGASRPRRSCRRRGSSRAAASPMSAATSRAPRKPTRARSPSPTAWRTTSRRSGTTPCASRSARCGFARAGSTTPRRRSASRWRACATAAGRSPGWSRSLRGEATPRPRRPRARRSSVPGSGPRRGRI
jgi:tetratricopeptide (TPR) repeat protein